MSWLNHVSSKGFEGSSNGFGGSSNGLDEGSVSNGFIEGPSSNGLEADLKAVSFESLPVAFGLSEWTLFKAPLLLNSFSS